MTCATILTATSAISTCTLRGLKRGARRKWALVPAFVFSRAAAGLLGVAVNRIGRWDGAKTRGSPRLRLNRQVRSSSKERSRRDPRLGAFAPGA